MHMYARFWKRLLDFLLALTALLVLSPLLLLLTVAGAVAMRGNPFFAQPRPGRGERIFRLIKFRTMSDRRDASGALLPDGERLNGYGRFLRKTSLDELPELFNILVGQMALVGPRPLLTAYLPLYSEEQHHRHDVRPGTDRLRTGSRAQRCPVGGAVPDGCLVHAEHNFPAGLPDFAGYGAGGFPT